MTTIERYDLFRKCIETVRDLKVVIFRFYQNIVCVKFTLLPLGLQFCEASYKVMKLLIVIKNF